VPLIDAAEAPSLLPEAWEWVRLGDLLLGDSQNGYSKKPDDAIDGIPILRISAGTVRKDGIVAEEEHKLIGGVPPSQQEQYQLKPGDLLACRFNGNRSFVGRLSLYLGYLGINPMYPDKLIRLRLLSEFVLPKLVRCFAESSVVRRDIEGYCATTVGNWGISASNLKEVKIPLPPLAEQHRIVAKVDELMALCDQLEAQLTTTEADSRRLLESVLHEALAQD
jgi:type I restriction enzyme S subunit